MPPADKKYWDEVAGENLRLYQMIQVTTATHLLGILPTSSLDKNVLLHRKIAARSLIIHTNTTGKRWKNIRIIPDNYDCVDSFVGKRVSTSQSHVTLPAIHPTPRSHRPSGRMQN